MFSASQTQFALLQKWEMESGVKLDELNEKRSINDIMQMPKAMEKLIKKDMVDLNAEWTYRLATKGIREMDHLETTCR